MRDPLGMWRAQGAATMCQAVLYGQVPYISVSHIRTYTELLAPLSTRTFKSLQAGRRWLNPLLPGARGELTSAALLAGNKSP